MKLMTIDEYRNNCYTKESRPSRRKIIRLIKDGTIYGKKHGKVFYVDIDIETSMTGNSLVDRVLKQKNE